YLTSAAPASPLFPYTTLFRSSGCPLCRPGDLGSRRSASSNTVLRPALRRWGRTPRPGGHCHLLDWRAMAHRGFGLPVRGTSPEEDRKSTRLNSSHVSISYAVF